MSGESFELFGVPIPDIRESSYLGSPHPGTLGVYRDITYGSYDETMLGMSERARYSVDPVAWAADRARVALWSKQREILQSVCDRRRIAVHSCHSAGKTFTAALVTAWWIDSHPSGTAFVVTTAPTGPQVKALLWREINRLHVSAGLPGRVNLTEWYLNNELVAYGRKPSEYNVAGFQGVHSLYVLVILDEACGIPDVLWTAAETIASNEHSKILAVGNPDSNDGQFARKCSSDSGWKVIHIGYRDTPNFTKEEVPRKLRDVLISEVWVEERRNDWGEESALFQSKVEGVFPGLDADPWTVIPLRFAGPCRYLELGDEEPIEGGIDVAAGGDRTVLVERRGRKVGRIEEFRSNDPIETVGVLAHRMVEWGLKRVKVDVIGVGWGIYGRLRELSSKHYPRGDRVYDAEIIPINFAEKSLHPKRFANKRAEVWWMGRELSRKQGWDLGVLDDSALGELTAPKYKIVDSRGVIAIEPKEDIINRLGMSPDVAEALLMAFYDGSTPGASTASDAVQTFRAGTSSRPNSASPFGTQQHRGVGPFPTRR